MESFLCLKVSLILLLLVHCVLVHGDCIHDVQPLSKIAIHRALFAIHVNASLRAELVLLGTKVTQIVFLFTFFLLCCFLSGFDGTVVKSFELFRVSWIDSLSSNCLFV